MRTRDSVLRLARFKILERQRQVAGLESMIAEFLRKQDELDALIGAEETRSGVSDIEHFNYSTSAKAARVRRDNLLASVGELNDQLAAAKAQLAEEEGEVRRMELVVGKPDGRVSAPVAAVAMSPSLST
jgi:flagellar FliJ protein